MRAKKPFKENFFNFYLQRVLFATISLCFIRYFFFGYYSSVWILIWSLQKHFFCCKKDKKRFDVGKSVTAFKFDQWDAVLVGEIHVICPIVRDSKWGRKRNKRLQFWAQMYVQINRQVTAAVATASEIFLLNMTWKNVINTWKRNCAR